MKNLKNRMRKLVSIALVVSMISGTAFSARDEGESAGAVRELPGSRYRFR